MNGNLAAVTLGLIAAISWGINSHIVKKAMVGQNAINAISIRSFFTAPLLIGGILIFKGFSHFEVYQSTDTMFLVILTALLIVLGDGIFLHGLKYFEVSLILTIASVYPLFTAIILIATGTETIGLSIILGTTVIIVGVSIVTSGRGIGNFSLIALFYGLGAAISWGTSIFFVRLILEKDGTEAIGLTGLRTFLMGLAALIVFNLSRESKSMYNQVSKVEKRRSIKLLALSGLVGWAIGASVFFFAVQKYGAQIPTPVSSTNPIIASIIGAYYGIETINQKQFLGILTTVLGTLIILI